MPVVIEGRVRMDVKEKDLIESYVGQPINPRTVDEFNAWIDLAAERKPSDTPEEKLMRAVIGGMRIDPGVPPDHEKRWKTQQDAPVRVLQFCAQKNRPI